jgi:maltose alpha-D-glucosyltransferase/alpha-amylase
MPLKYDIKEQSLCADRLAAELPAIVAALPPDYIQAQRWFGSKSLDIREVKLFDASIMEHHLSYEVLLLLEIHYMQKAKAEMYFLPLVITEAPSTASIMQIVTPSKTYYIVDALQNEPFLRRQLALLASASIINAGKGSFKYENIRPLLSSKKAQAAMQNITHVTAQQSNTSTVYNERFIMKTFRHLSPGISPDLEIPLFLIRRTNFKFSAPVAGYIQYRSKDKLSMTIASLQLFQANQGDGWQYTLQYLDYLFDKILAYEAFKAAQGDTTSAIRNRLVSRYSAEYLQQIYGLGEITGKLHTALASVRDEPAFTPEVITVSQSEKWMAQLRDYTDEVMRELGSGISIFAAPLRGSITKLIERREDLKKQINGLQLMSRAGLFKTRYHGDYHLGQVLKTDDGFIIIDFEGEPARSPAEKRLKHSPLKDVAGMLRSFNYALYTKLFVLAQGEIVQSGNMEAWGRAWEQCTRQAFLEGYFVSAGLKRGNKGPGAAVKRAITVFQMEKALYEMSYEMNNRPLWIEIPLKYLLTLIN